MEASIDYSELELKNYIFPYFWVGPIGDRNPWQDQDLL